MNDYLKQILLGNVKPVTDYKDPMLAFANVQGVRANLPSDNPGQKPLSVADRYYYTRAMINEGPLQAALGLTMPVLAAGEQGLKGLASLAGMNYGRSGFHPQGIIGAAQGVRHGLGDIVNRYF
jgi:hypothetical protein